LTITSRSIFRRRRAGTLAAAIAVGAIAVAIVGGAATAEASPLDGNGSWIWYVSASGGSPGAVARHADRKGLDTVYVKSSDGGSYWNQFSPKLVDALHDRGIEACAWPFVYGDDPGREARVSAKAADAGADCIVIDAEGTYEGRYEQAYKYIHKLRRLVGPRYPIALSSFPYADYHPTFPYSVFLGADGARFNVPQIYWHAIGDSVREAYEHTYLWNRAYDRPIFPLGQTWQDPGKEQLLDFRRFANEFGADGVSWWSWQETNGKEWGIVGRDDVRGVPGYKAKRRFASLRRGDSGDLVVLAQELLIADGRKAKPTGKFDGRTQRAVEGFQEDSGLDPDGRIGDSTWRLLVELEPASTNWKRTAVPRTLSRTARQRGDGAEFSPPPQPRVAEPGAGPVALKRVGLEQHNLKLAIRFTVANPLPPLRDLKRYPSAVGSDERHMCLVADGSAIERRLICVGGQVERHHIELGVSQFRKGGDATKLHGVSAKLERTSANSIKVELPLRKAGFDHGRFRYYAASAWIGSGCGPAPRDEVAAVVCHARAPESGRNKGRIFKVVRSGCTPGKHGLITNGPRNEKKIALTFDDGPSAYTSRILGALDHAHVEGTFFDIGSQVHGADPGLLRKIIDHGHEIGNHSWAHETLPSGSSMSATSSAIRAVTGFKPCHFRPPGGAYNSGTISAAAQNGMSVVNWDVDTRDWTGISSGAIAAEATSGGSGSIVLMHDGGGNRAPTAAAVPHIIHTLKKRGYKLVTLTELLGGHFKLREKH
jgi:peptidoglycan/xylan/chitin deacetylase (PgdA/CDA1 family)